MFEDKSANRKAQIVLTSVLCLWLLLMLFLSILWWQDFLNL